MLADIGVTATPEGAEGFAYMFTVDGHDTTKPATIPQFGHYEDRLVKTRDGWRFRERIFFFELNVLAAAAR